MKRILLVTIMLLFAGLMVYAQQAGGAQPAGDSAQPTSAQTKQNAQQTLSQSKSNSSEFESTLASLKTQNTSNDDAAAYKRLKAHVEHLESEIKAEQARMQVIVDQGQKISPGTLEEMQKLIDQHKEAMSEIEAFVAK